MSKKEEMMYKSIADLAKAIEKLVKLIEKNVRT
jgi:hypothetical protein